MLCGSGRFWMREKVGFGDEMFSWVHAKCFCRGHLCFKLRSVVSTAFITVTEFSLENMIASEDEDSRCDAVVVTSYE